MLQILTLVAALLAGLGGVFLWVHFARGAPRLWELGKRLLEGSVALGIVLIAWTWIRG